MSAPRPAVPGARTTIPPTDARPGGLRAVARALLVLAAAALALVGLAPASASAHGGILLGSAVAGPYRTQVTAAPLTEPGKPPAIDVTVYVSNATTSAPVSGAKVRTTVQADGRTVRPEVREIAGGYEAIVPVKDAYTVGKQTIDVDIAGPLGSGHVTVRPLKKDGGPPVVLVVATVVLLLGLLALTVRVRRRRAIDGGDDDVWPDRATA
ncbi:hypothetical protein [Patulibacter minatonensis]|uniref:hypothetical protein n=1 Tax=Patulibacter minatonensis TaxID=298163 RepID=UPI0012FCD05E|nr:hypothetical protein [Patulibacter minatonensis]